MDETRIAVMGDELEECGICFEEKDDLRMLPCFHVGCITCILGMTQTGQGRAVSCHICRQPCLFENIRSLPRPVRCEACKNLAKNPKKFPCCTRLLCSSCISRTTSSESFVFCPNKCNNAFYAVDDLQNARICRTCFRLNTDSVAGCGHAICSQCQISQAMQRRECPLCSALHNPVPIAVNPVQPTPGQAHAALQGVVQQQSPDLDQMQLQAAFQIIGRQFQANAGQQQQLFGVPYSQAQCEKDLMKALVFVAILFVSGFFTGLTYWLWIVGGASLLLLQQNAVFIQLECIILNILLCTASFFQNFWQFLGILLFDLMVTMGINFVCKYQALKGARQPLLLAGAGVYFWISYQYLAPIFWHQMAMKYTVQFLSGILKKKE